MVFTHPKSRAARKLIIGGRNELDSEWSTGVISELHEEKKIRIVFSENSSYEPVISNMIMTIGCPVNILRADTKSVNGKAKGEMILGLPQEKDAQNSIIEYLKDHNLDVEEVTGDVE